MDGPRHLASTWTGAARGNGDRLHGWFRAGDAGATGRPLVCLHPMPHDGAFFDPAATRLARRRPLLCPDYPGFGRSPALPRPWSLEAWADALAAGLPELLGDAALETGGDGTVDLLGFHTGCLVAAELALEHPDRVNAIVMIDVPFFDTGLRRELEENTVTAARYHGKPVAIEGFRTAFAYDPIRRFRSVRHETLVIGTASSLHGPSEAAAKAMPGARFLGRDDIVAPVFEAGTEAIATCVDTFLDAN